MTPKEKAIELVDKYRNTIMSFLSDNMKDMNAKKCATLAVEEILNDYEEFPYKVQSGKEYWMDVWFEIEKL